MTGTPGTGKTTFSRLLSGRLGAAYVDLSAYALDHGYVLERDEERDTGVVDLEALRTNAWRLMWEGRDVVLDGHYSHEVAPPGLTRIVFVLRRAPWLLLEELMGRGYRAEKAWENVEAEIIGVCLSEALEKFSPEQVCSLDTSDHTPEETLESGIAALRRGCQADEVDWLGRKETLELLRGRTCTS